MPRLPDRRDWWRYAKALDMRLEGYLIEDIARHFGVTKQRATQMLQLAKAQLAYRVFKGIRRPLRDNEGWRAEHRTNNETIPVDDRTTAARAARQR